MSVRFAGGGRFGSTGTQAQISPGTFAAWIKPLSFPASLPAVCLGQCDDTGASFLDLLGLNTGGAPFFYTFDSAGRTVTSSVAIPKGVWTHIAATVANSSVIAIYVNGIARGTTATANVAAATMRLLVGGVPGGAIASSYTSFDGEIQDACVFTAVLSAPEILDLASGRSPLEIRPLGTALRNYWPLAQDRPFLDLSRNRELLTPTGNWWKAAAASPYMMDRAMQSMEFVAPLPALIGLEEAAQIYVDIQAGGSEGGPYSDASTVYVDVQPSGVELQTVGDFATVYVDILPGGSEVQGIQTTDTGTVYVNISNTGGECYSTFSADYFGEGEATLQWSGEANLRWSGEANLRWSAFVSIGDTVHC